MSPGPCIIQMKLRLLEMSDNAQSKRAGGPLADKACSLQNIPRQPTTTAEKKPTKLLQSTLLSFITAGKRADPIATLDTGDGLAVPRDIDVRVKRKASELDSSSDQGSVIPVKKAQRQSSKVERLLALTNSPDTIISFVQRLYKPLDINQLALSNQYLPPVAIYLLETDLVFKTDAVDQFGHCCARCIRKRTNGRLVQELVLWEKGSKTNRDPPRVSGCGLESAGKVYIYHLVAAYVASTKPRMGMTLELLDRVSQGKSEENAQTIRHLCGHGVSISSIYVFLSRPS